MLIGIPREIRPAQTRVAATPATATQLIKLGHEVVVERGAGAQAAFPDAAYEAVGASLVEADHAWRAEIVFSVDSPTDEQLGWLRPGSLLVSTLDPAAHPDLVARLAADGVTAMSLDAVPRISRAQSLDVLSSMANLAGYRAIIEAAEHFGGVFNGQVTAAGKMPPAHVFVVGAGVAGLAAIGTAGSLGAEVRAFDVRPEVAEQIESMGADFVRVDAVDSEISSDGYARGMSAEQAEVAARMYAAESARADIVVTTAQVRGKPAPLLITDEMIAAMRPGSVIVDLAASTGGNAALTKVDEIVVSDNQVTVIGISDLAARLPRQASELVGTNLVNLMKLLTPAKDGAVVIDLEDQVIRSMTVSHAGDVLWPPPPVHVSAAPAVVPRTTVVAPVEDPQVLARRKRQRTLYGGGLVLVLFALVGAVSPLPLLAHWLVLMLAVVTGFYVISNVSHALHTPLMAETNAISGIIMVGALLQVGSANWAVTVVAMAAILLASVNIAGGFIVTRKMLNMFRSGHTQEASK
ncbi:Re/Si-specific NAD(P)(+) transhydrogenase subunit alpha [Aestuariimicrobium sp. T2.26MG-19.2B]|uniref:Re/Si-specific NAD(P)(+) transhydrogenase subunit alpha n=1 Tax=Aestuariimicrobium sp. T2.26MG-19.2B TaxID=3040679 RepID=UPI002477B224|nr:Re/Si-specific NAD(P)(+) transhydrogenase subunit alpha [Aestuariimicrobium sp. T2.26MG-19.2B]CAI9406604.1 NAD(P) transhydrogenase subunit alpha [Aestuariimicrobium sp. T2.26MG-19.2B]